MLPLMAWSGITVICPVPVAAVFTAGISAIPLRTIAIGCWAWREIEASNSRASGTMRLAIRPGRDTTLVMTTPEIAKAPAP